MNDHKYIYEFYIVPENAEIAKVRYPVVYESDKEIVIKFWLYILIYNGELQNAQINDWNYLTNTFFNGTI